MDKGTLSGNMFHTILAPQQLTATTQSDVVNLANYNHGSFFINVGVAATPTFALTVEYCDDNTPTTDTAMAFKYRKKPNTTSTWGALTDATSSGITLDTASYDYVIEMDSIDIPTASSSTESRVALKFTDPSAADSFISAVAVLGIPRFAQDTPHTCID